MSMTIESRRDAFARARSRAAWKSEEQQMDQDRGEFLRAIDAGVENLSDFEINFIESFLGVCAARARERDHEWFTEARRKVVDNMIHRYGMRRLNPQTAANRLPESQPGRCGYLLPRSESGSQRRCNAVAVIKLRNGLELCSACNQVREDGLAKLRAAKERQLRS